jgi:pectate lyase
MRRPSLFVALLCSIILLLAPGASAVAASGDGHTSWIRERLAANDGWASFSTGTTGGSNAAPQNVRTVSTRAQLNAALSELGATPKIIQIRGTIDANVDANNRPLSCADYQRNGFTLEQYLATYDPAVWGRTTRPSGPVEDARLASQRAQADSISIRIPSNTTLVGLGHNARLIGAQVRLDQVDNVIIRNITFVDAFDCFPAWDPTDGSLGNWNSQYDNIALRGSTHVWVDHNAFNDGNRPDSAQPIYFGRPFQVHDGALDITNASDLVTVSWNRFEDHDKVMLIGSSDSGNTAANDRGKLRVTIHHNVFDNLGQRVPRVRFGMVHVYNNYYTIKNVDTHVYSWGVGIESQIYAENNFFRTPRGFPVAELIQRFNGTMIHAEGTLINGFAPSNRVDVVAAYNAATDPDLVPSVNWEPTLHLRVHATAAVPALVEIFAGPRLALF